MWVTKNVVLFFLLILASIPPYLWLKGRLDVVSNTQNFKTAASQSDVACEFPRLDPWDEDIPRRSTYLKCPEQDLVFELDFQRSEILNISKGNALYWTTCCYRTVHRGTNFSDLDNDNKESLSDECFPIRGPRTQIPPEHEFLAIFCDSAWEKGVMIQAFALAPLKPDVEAILSPFTASNDESVNVVILGWEGASHLEMQRTLPRVRKFLTKDLSALWLEGYTKLGLGTFPNLLPFIAGLTGREAKGGCAKDLTFDACPLFWKEFAMRGYRTSFAEDAPDIGLFTFFKHGFILPPVDYYLRPLARVADAHIMGGRSRLWACWGPQLALQILLNYMKSLAHNMGRDRRYVQFIWSTRLTHSFRGSGVLGEGLVLDFLQWMQSEGHLNQSVLIFMSDHGLRDAKDFLGSPRHKSEVNMPFLYAVFPKWFRRKYPKALANFRENRERLTTHYDGHETLLDIGNLDKITDDAILKRSKDLEDAGTLPRGISLFLPIPKRRTCKMARIEVPFCVCGKRQGIPTNDPDALEGARRIVSHLNNVVPPHLCAHMSLQSVQSAALFSPGGGEEDLRNQLYEVSLVTSPGNATFDATVIKSIRGIRFWFSGKPWWSVSGPVSRSNLYGNQSFCVDQKEMKPYCFCVKDQRSSFVRWLQRILG